MKWLYACICALLSVTVSAQSWCPKADFGGIGRHRCSGFSIGNKGYVGIGHMNGSGVNIVYQDWWQYDPASNSWTQKADYASGTPNYGAIAFSTSTKGYIGGGVFLSTEFFCYDPVLNTWTAIASCPESLSDQTAFSINEKGYVLGASALIEYNPTSNSWIYKQNLPAGFAAWASAFVIDGSAYVKSQNSLYEYKAAQDQWLVRAAFPGLATSGSSAFTSHGKGYIITGYAGFLAAVTKEVWEYNPATNTWLQKDDFEGAGRRFSVGFSIDERGYFGLGTNGINFNDFWAFDYFTEITDNDPLQVSCTTYPNPAVSTVHFRLSDAIGNDPWTLTIVNTLGETVQTTAHTGKEAKFERGNISNGTYYFQVEQAGKVMFSDAFQLSGL
ncbi:MAG: T9SS type A sorting domain-containing protein [Bacteroidota bacterium]